MTIVNGYIEDKHIYNENAELIFKWVENLRTRSGNGVRPIYKRWRTQYSSIQGIWNPELHKPFDAPKTSDEILQRLSELSMCKDDSQVSAQDQLLNLYEKRGMSIDLK